MIKVPLRRLFHSWLLLMAYMRHEVRGNEGVPTTTTTMTPSSSRGQPPIFSPIVTATCRAGTMTVKVETADNFLGVVQSRDYRKPQCSSYGENTRITFLHINMLAQPFEDDFCGVFITEDKDEFSVAVAVRVHKTLELAGDKFYMITCGKAGFQNTRNETSLVNLELLRDDEIVQHVVYGQDYTLRAHITQPDGKFDMKVKRCFSFSNTNNTVQLIDERGCPMPDIISEFKYNRMKGIAEAKLFSMFKFPESNRVHFQCDILVCKGRCSDVNCNEIESPRGRALLEPLADALLSPVEDGALMASYSVFVLEPGEQVDVDSICQDCSQINSLVYYLCLAFGILFLVMLIVNVYLCCAMTSANTRTCAGSQHKKKEERPVVTLSKPEDFDPYARSWHGSQYESRYSLNGGAPVKQPVPYISAGDSKAGTHSPQTSDECTSRPGSRYSQFGRSRPRSRSNHRHPIQSSSSASTQYSRAESTGRLMMNNGIGNRNHHH